MKCKESGPPVEARRSLLESSTITDSIAGCDARVKSMPRAGLAAASVA
jgi:hypothetical protein